MKSSEMERVIGKILQSGLVLPQINLLKGRDRQRALMYMINYETGSAGGKRLILDCIEELGFRDEEVLIFLTAVIPCRPQLVPRIVKRFCRNPKIARPELLDAIFQIIGYAESVKDASILLSAVECLELYGGKIRWNHRKPNSQETKAYAKIWWSVLKLRKDPDTSVLVKKDSEQVEAHLRELVTPDEIKPILEAVTNNWWV